MKKIYTLQNKPGFIVKTKSGKVGRTVHGQPFVNDKIPVYLAIEGIKNKSRFGYADSFSKNAILCDPKTLQQVGFIY